MSRGLGDVYKRQVNQCDHSPDSTCLHRNWRFVCYSCKLFCKMGVFKSLPKSIGCGIIIACVSAGLAVPTTAFFLGGFVGTGASAIVTALMTAGWGVLPATFVSELSTETMDKIICLIIVFFILKSIPSRLVVKLPNAKFFIKDVEE